MTEDKKKMTAQSSSVGADDGQSISTNSKVSIPVSGEEINDEIVNSPERLEDGTLLSIDCTAVENEAANSMYQLSELDWLIYNDPLAYAELILNGDLELYLKAVIKKTPLD